MEPAGKDLCWQRARSSVTSEWCPSESCVPASQHQKFVLQHCPQMELRGWLVDLNQAIHWTWKFACLPWVLGAKLDVSYPYVLTSKEVSKAADCFFNKFKYFTVQRKVFPPNITWYVWKITLLLKPYCSHTVRQLRMIFDWLLDGWCWASLNNITGENVCLWSLSWVCDVMELVTDRLKTNKSVGVATEGS